MDKIDQSGFGRRRIERVNKALLKPITPKRYRRQHLWVKTIKPTLHHLKPSELGKLRLRHFRNAIALIKGTRNTE